MKRFSSISTLAATLVGAGLITMPMIGSAQEANPSVDLTDLAVVCTDDPCSQTGSFDIINVSDEPRTVTVASITGTIVFIGQGGVMTECDATIVTVPPTPFDIGPLGTQPVTYTLTCDVCPPEASEAREVLHIVEVTLDGRLDKVFRSTGSCFPFGGEVD